MAEHLLTCVRPKVHPITEKERKEEKEEGEKMWTQKKGGVRTHGETSVTGPRWNKGATSQGCHATTELQKP